MSIAQIPGLLASHQLRSEVRTLGNSASPEHGMLLVLLDRYDEKEKVKSYAAEEVISNFPSCLKTRIDFKLCLYVSYASELNLTGLC